ncbi:protein of unknown function [Agrobacterium pusense]|uniref:Uncharacterized protein n=1 Tax=Agrobacterium pusense TaxID=648995 RepID=U4PUD9_9HYPH|nr:protein of unknown function [Agrobacterium pusense]
MIRYTTAKSVNHAVSSMPKGGGAGFLLKMGAKGRSSAAHGCRDHFASHLVYS